MKLSVATNFDDKLILGLTPYPVAELYGKLPNDYLGGGRSSYMLAPLSKRKLEQHIDLARKNGIGFNYLLNAACLNNCETTRQGQREIRKTLDWLSEIQVTAITVSNPLLLRIIKREYPHFKVRVSVFAGVDHLTKAKYWEHIGADVICLDSLTVNRDLPALKSIKKGVHCGLELLANGNCLQSCSLSQTHMNLLAHSSQKGHQNKGFVLDHCVLECTKMKVMDPINFLRSDWIRPEDIHMYENLGFDLFKLVERNLPTPLMIKRVKAYSEGKYKGNLIDLIQPYGHTRDQGNAKYNAHRFFYSLSFLFKPMKINIFKLRNMQKLAHIKGMLQPIEGPPPVWIENSLLSGFLENVFRKDCRNLDCTECRYCYDTADKVITIDPAYKDKCLQLHDQLENDILSGRMWSYGQKEKKAIQHALHS